MVHFSSVGFWKGQREESWNHSRKHRWMLGICGHRRDGIRDVQEEKTRHEGDTPSYEPILLRDRNPGNNWVNFHAKLRE